MSRTDGADGQEKFESFLIEMDDVLEVFTKELTGEGYRLDGSLASLDELERYFVERCAGRDSRDIERFVQRGARYLGEVVRKTYGGRWSLGDPYGLGESQPLIAGHSPFGVEFPPHEIMRNFVHRGQRGLLRQAVVNDISPDDLALTPEE